MKIAEQEIPGMGGGIRREKYNSYGVASRSVEINDFVENNTIVRVLNDGVTQGEVCIDGRFVYTTRRKSLKEGHTKPESQIDDGRRSDARFCAKLPQGDVGTNDVAPTSELRSLGVLFSIIAYGN